MLDTFPAPAASLYSLKKTSQGPEHQSDSQFAAIPRLTRPPHVPSTFPAPPTMPLIATPIQARLIQACRLDTCTSLHTHIFNNSFSSPAHIFRCADKDSITHATAQSDRRRDTCNRLLSQLFRLLSCLHAEDVGLAFFTYM